MGSRLFDEIREQRGLAYSVYSRRPRVRRRADPAALGRPGLRQVRRGLHAHARDRRRAAQRRARREEEFERARAYAAGRRVLAFENTNAVARHAAAQTVVFGAGHRPRRGDRRARRGDLRRRSPRSPAGIPDELSVACVGPHDASTSSHSLTLARRPRSSATMRRRRDDSRSSTTASSSATCTGSRTGGRSSARCSAARGSPTCAAPAPQRERGPEYVIVLVSEHFDGVPWLERVYVRPARSGTPTRWAPRPTSTATRRAEFERKREQLPARARRGRAGPRAAARARLAGRCVPTPRDACSSRACRTGHRHADAARRPPSCCAPSPTSGWSRWRATGHERAFEAIVERYRRPLLRACAGVLPEARAEDALQQALLAAWTALAARRRGARAAAVAVPDRAQHRAQPAARRRLRLRRAARVAARSPTPPRRSSSAARSCAQTLDRPGGAARAPARGAAADRRQGRCAGARSRASSGSSRGARAPARAPGARELRAAATALTPLPLRDLGGGCGRRAAARRSSGSPSCRRGGGASLTLAKAGAVVVLAGSAVAGPAIVDRRDAPVRRDAVAGGRRTPAARRARAEPATPAAGTTDPSLGGGPGQGHGEPAAPGPRHGCTRPGRPRPVRGEDDRTTRPGTTRARAARVPAATAPASTWAR